MDVIYVSIVCPQCKRQGAIPFSRLELRQKLDERDPVILFCGYDDVTWPAAPRERIQMLKLLGESDSVGHGSFIRHRSELSRIGIE
jgi:hypothetical protein